MLEFSYSPTGKITIQIQPDFAENHGKQTQKGFLLSNEKMSCRHTKSPFYTLWRLEHVLWKKWVRLVTSLTAFSILLHNQYIRTEQYSYFFFLSCWSIKKWTSGACGGGCEGTRCTYLPTGPAKTRFFEPTRLSSPPKPLFSLKPLNTTTWLRSLLSKVFPIMNTVLSHWLSAWWVFY